MSSETRHPLESRETGLPVRVTRTRPLERRFRYALLGPLTNLLLRTSLRRRFDDALTLARVVDPETGTARTVRVGVHHLPHNENRLYIIGRGDWWEPLTAGGTLSLLLDDEWQVVAATVSNRRRSVARFARDYVAAYGRDAGKRIGVLVEGSGEPIRAHFLRALEETALLTIDIDDDGDGGASEREYGGPFMPASSSR
ncbi:hypothetical protein [Haloarchaeobius amylolyticus]|uniref:hypothetical protein n=1 Tax=Haloarchaeobius amylolyticus TaxID=1198296 RepID=UPI00226EB924|nr:hypothetical protein [Haloarchaeobius amylolyticus]